MLNIEKFIWSLVIAFILTFTNAEKQLKENEKEFIHEYECVDESDENDENENEDESEDEEDENYVGEYELIENRSSFDDNDTILIEHFNELESNGEYQLYSLSHYCKDNLILNKNCIQYYHLFKQITICRTLIASNFTSL